MRVAVSDEKDGTAATTSRRRLWVIVGIVALVVLAAAGIILAAVLGRPQASPSTPTPSTSSSTAAPSASATPSATPSAVPSSSSPAPAPAPSAGQEVPVTFQDVPTVSPGLTVTVREINPVEGTSDAPGEIAGPSLQFVVDFANSSDQPVSLAQVAVNADYGQDRTPAIELDQEQSEQVPAEVAPGQTVSGSYVYNVPEDQRDLVRLLVFTNVDAPVFAFEGSTPR